MAKISIIIPVYNVEKYLDECLLSVRGQTLKDLEIICINDGSTDKSLEILNSHKSADDRIKIITQSNGGQSSARNRGIEIASGEYYYFMDSDDKIELNAMEVLYHTADENQLDLLMFGASTIFESAALRNQKSNFLNYYKRRNVYKGVMSGWALFEKLFTNNEYFVSPCCLFISQALIADNHLRFIEGMVHEDHVFCFSLIANAKRSKCIQDTLFIRRIREGSTMTEAYSMKRVYGRIRAALEIFAMARGFEIDPTHMPFVARECASLINSALSEHKLMPLRAKMANRMDANDVLLSSVLSLIKSHNVEDPYQENFAWPSQKECRRFLSRHKGDKPLLSVIVPVYNEKKYLQEALDSIRHQTMEQLEVICIDDCSTDGSADILDEYARYDKRFRVIHLEENAGHGHAINTGIQYASADYIGFLDSDDFLDKEAFAALYTAVCLNNLNFIKADIANYYEDRDESEYGFVRLTNNVNHYNKILNPRKDVSLYLTVPNNVTGVYNKSFLLDHAIFYGQKPHASCQDILFTFKTMYYATRIAFVDKAYYHYRRNAESSLSGDGERARDIMDVYAEIFDFLQGEQDDTLWNIYERTKYDRYKYAMTKMSGERLFSFIYEYRSELINAEESGNLDLSSFTPEGIKDIRSIMDSPDQYFASLVSAISYDQRKSLEGFIQETRDALTQRELLNIYSARQTAKTNYKVAVVIPVYNAEQYLSQCLDSVLGQSLGDEVQVIAVDDGSTDDSLNILIGYARKHTNLDIYVQTNKGAGPARNHALDAARAEYVAFLDADDTYASADVLEALYSKAVSDHLDIVGGWRQKKIGDRIYEADENPDESGLLKYIDNQIDFGYQSYIFNLKMINDNQFRFPDYRRYQDPPFFVRAMICAGTYYIVDMPTYVYRVGNNSVNWDARKISDYASGLHDELMLCVENQLHDLALLIRQRIARNSDLFAGEMLHGNIDVLMKMVEMDSVFASMPEVQCAELEPIKAYRQAMTKGQRNRPKANEIAEYERRLRESNQLIDAYRFANSWRIGRIITYVPRQMKKVVKSLREDGAAPTARRIICKVKAMPEILRNF